MKKINLLLAAAMLLLYSCGQQTPKEYDLTQWPEGKSPEEIGVRLTNKFLSLPHSQFGITPPPHPVTQITYPDVCAWLGGLWFAKELKDDSLVAKLEARFQPLFDEEAYLLPVPNHVDNNVFGALPLELYLQKGDEKYLELGLHYADTQWQVPDSARDEEKAYAEKGYSWLTRIWIDDMFMITAVQAQAFRATGNDEYINRAAREMVFYLDQIQLENGLFHHAPDAPFSWGRGNGWMAAGVAELLRILPDENPDKERIMEGYQKMMAALLQFQAEDGMWRQIIDDEESWKETSSTAMFTYAMITGVQNGWLDEVAYGTAARKGWLALTTYLNEDDQLTNVCAGTVTKNDRDHYMNRPKVTGDLHGHAPFIWCSAALLRK